MASKKTLSIVFCCAMVLSSSGQFFRMFQPRENRIQNARLVLEPSQVVVGQPCEFVFEFEVPANVTIEGLQVNGLPEMNDDVEYMADSFENLADGTTTNTANVVKRFALPLRFNAPYSNVLHTAVSGNVGTRVQRRGFSSSSFSSFSKRLPPLNVSVRPLPAEGKPEGYTGAVGLGFKLTASADPRRVHPGDLVTIVYTLEYDGYVPDGSVPKTKGLDSSFTVYGIKPGERPSKKKIQWSQVVIPKTSAATNAVSFSIPYYNLEKRKYMEASGTLPALEFVSAEKASTENVSVIVTEEAGTEGVNIGTNRPPARVHFAPNAASPVLQTLPAGVKMKETQRYGKWLRIETEETAGWILKDGR